MKYKTTTKKGATPKERSNLKSNMPKRMNWTTEEGQKAIERILTLYEENIEVMAGPAGSNRLLDDLVKNLGIEGLTANKCKVKFSQLATTKPPTGNQQMPPNVARAKEISIKLQPHSAHSELRHSHSKKRKLVDDVAPYNPEDHHMDAVDYAEIIQDSNAGAHDSAGAGSPSSSQTSFASVESTGRPYGPNDHNPRASPTSNSLMNKFLSKKVEKMEAEATNKNPCGLNGNDHDGLVVLGGKLIVCKRCGHKIWEANV